MKNRKIMIVEWEQKYTDWQKWNDHYIETLVEQSGYIDANVLIGYIKSL